jgi:hypothetical protein
LYYLACSQKLLNWYRSVPSYNTYWPTQERTLSKVYIRKGCEQNMKIFHVFVESTLIVAAILHERRKQPRVDFAKPFRPKFTDKT